MFQDKTNEFGFEFNRWHHIVLSLSEKNSSIYFNDKKKSFNPNRSSKNGNLGSIISSIISQKVYFFSQFIGRFFELRIWKIERTEEEISDLKTRPLQIVFDKLDDVGFKMKKKIGKKEVSEGNFKKNIRMKKRKSLNLILFKRTP